MPEPVEPEAGNGTAIPPTPPKKKRQPVYRDGGLDYNGPQLKQGQQDFNVQNDCTLGWVPNLGTHDYQLSLLDGPLG